jgi:hypothetical protein
VLFHMPPSKPKIKANRNEVVSEAELVALYNLYRSALMNEKYFGRRLHHYRTLNRYGEIILAVTASSTVGGWAVWTTGWGALAWKGLACFSTLLALLKPVLQLSKHIELHSKVYVGYCSLYFDLKALVDDVQRTHSFTPELRKTQKQAQERYKNLALQVDFPSRRKVLTECMNEVNEQIPPDTLWFPSKGLAKGLQQ